MSQFIKLCPRCQGQHIFETIQVNETARCLKCDKHFLVSEPIHTLPKDKVIQKSKVSKPISTFEPYPKKIASLFTQVPIGKFARQGFELLFTLPTFNVEALADFQTEAFSRKTFSIRFPVLSKERLKTPNQKSTSEPNSYFRHASLPIVIHGSDYFLCNHWFDKDNHDHLECLIALFERFEVPYQSLCTIAETILAQLSDTSSTDVSDSTEISEPHYIQADETVRSFSFASPIESIEYAKPIRIKIGPIEQSVSTWRDVVHQIMLEVYRQNPVGLFDLRGKAIMKGRKWGARINTCPNPSRTSIEIVHDLYLDIHSNAHGLIMLAIQVMKLCGVAPSTVTVFYSTPKHQKITRSSRKPSVNT